MEPEQILIQMESILKELKETKPYARTELGRCYAITITDMEKVIAYFKMFVVGQV